jgi:hypothetical protein
VNQFYNSLTIKNKGKIYMSNKTVIRCDCVFFYAEDVANVNLMAKGVGVNNHQGQLIFWHPETNKDQAKKVANALTDAVLGKKAIDWDSLIQK